MSERHVTLTTRVVQRPFGDTLYEAIIDFEYLRSDFGGAPPERAAIEVVKALWPSVRNCELTARPATTATMSGWGASGEATADRWRVSGKVRYAD